MADDTGDHGTEHHDTDVHDPAALDPDADRVSKRTARKAWWVLAAFVVVVVVAVGVVSNRQERKAKPAPAAFCKAAKAYEKELDRQAEDYELDIERQIEKVQTIADTAPKSVKADAELFLAQLQKIAAAPTAAERRKLQDDEDVKRAVDNVNRRWNQGCGVFDRDSAI